MIFNFFKSYSEKDIIEAVSFLDEIDEISKKYVSDMDMQYLLRDITLDNPHQVRNIKLVGIYYHALTKKEMRFPIHYCEDHSNTTHQCL